MRPLSPSIHSRLSYTLWKVGDEASLPLPPLPLVIHTVCLHKSGFSPSLSPQWRHRFHCCPRGRVGDRESGVLLLLLGSSRLSCEGEATAKLSYSSFGRFCLRWFLVHFYSLQSLPEMLGMRYDHYFLYVLVCCNLIGQNYSIRMRWRYCTQSSVQLLSILIIRWVWWLWENYGMSTLLIQWRGNLGNSGIAPGVFLKSPTKGCIALKDVCLKSA